MSEDYSALYVEFLAWLVRTKRYNKNWYEQYRAGRQTCGYMEYLTKAHPEEFHRFKTIKRITS